MLTGPTQNMPLHSFTLEWKEIQFPKHVLLEILDGAQTPDTK